MHFVPILEWAVFIDKSIIWVENVSLFNLPYPLKGYHLSLYLRMYSVYAILFAKSTMESLSYKVIWGCKVVLFAVSLGSVWISGKL